MGDIVERVQCPKCLDSSKDNLVRYTDGAHCYACGYSEFEGKGMSYELPFSISLPSNGITSKKLTLATCRAFGVVHVAATDDEGNPITKQNEDGTHTYRGSGTLALPYYNADGTQMVGAKMRTTGEERKMWADGNLRDASFFGFQALRSSLPTLVLTEGETDTMTIHQVCTDVAVLGVPGADAVTKCLKASLRVVRKFRKVIILFDNDPAGHRATEAALSMLPAGTTYVANYPAGYKDANEMLLANKESELRGIIKNARAVTPAGVVDSETLRNKTLDFIFKKSATVGASTGWRELDKAIGGLAPGKLLTVCGGTGSGKSTVTETIAVNASKAGVHTFFIPLEMTEAQVSARMTQQIVGEPFISDPYYDVSSINRKQLEEAISHVSEHIHFYDHFGAIKLDTLVETCEFAVDAYGVQLIVLDHITAASEGLDWKDLDATAKALKALALRKNVCIIAVNHISRDGDNEDNVPSLKHIRGGNGVAQYSDCVLGVGRKRDSNEMTVRTIKVDRMVGKFVEFQLVYENCALYETGVSFDVEQTGDDEDNGSSRKREVPRQDTRGSSGGVPQSVREEYSVDERVGVRTDDSNLRGEREALHPRLDNTGNEHNNRVQGDTGRSGQEENDTSEGPTPSVRVQTAVPGWEFETV